MNIQTKVNKTCYKDKVAIIVVGYNRIKSIKRVLYSLLNADYPNCSIPLIISIDCSGDTELYSYVENFDWPNGDKIINIQQQRLGLKNHIFQCGDLSEYFRGVIVLEDDIYVSKDFYNFTVAALDKYEEEDKVAGIALYSQEYVGMIQLPFQPLNNGSDCYAFQTVCSWGQCWNYRMWSDFRKWLNKWDKDFSKVSMPMRIKQWEKAWSKFYFAYEILTDRYFIVPYVSQSTCFNDVGGVHGGDCSANQQVSLQFGKKKYNFVNFSSLVKYDVYANNIQLYDQLGFTETELCLDLYGTAYEDNNHKNYLLTINHYNYKVMRTYGLQLRPIELNIFSNITGSDIILYNCNEKVSGDIEKYPIHTIEYFIKNFNNRLLALYVTKKIYRKIINKIRLIFKK